MNETKKKSEEESREGFFWDRLSKLQKLIGFFTALFALIGGLYGGYKFIFPEPPPSPQPPNPETEILKLRKCANLKVKTFEHMPYYLTPTLYKKARNWLYWAVLSGKNDCEKDVLLVKVRFLISQQSSHLAYLAQAKKGIIEERLVTDKPQTENESDTLTYWKGTVDPMESKTEPIFPKINFNKEDPDEPLFVEWQILRRKDNQIIKENTEHINIISKKYIYWDLKDAFGANVPADFLLASMSAWTQNKSPELQKRARQYLSEASRGQPRPWLKGCYDHLLGPEGFLDVRPYNFPWPLKGSGDLSRQPLRSPVEFIKGHGWDPNSLEAVLLLGALANNLPNNFLKRWNLTLFALPRPAEGGEKRFLLAWSADGKNWQALDLTSPRELSFEDNEAKATAELAAQLQANPEMLGQLALKGVFIEGERFSEGARQILALDFAKAAELYSIQGLP